jgi:redox-sensitive bicupin YhaK (pirin superfamily)
VILHLRKSSERGKANFGWLRSFHSFSFGQYFDPQFMGFQSLRVINEDFIAGGGGFPTHGHKNMEIITVILKGALEHKDSLGNQSIIKPGEVQKMSAGQGILHSEFNHYPNQETHLLQIWIEPNRMVPTSYQQLDFSDSYLNKALTLICSPNGEENSISIAQNAKLYMGHLHDQQILNYSIEPKHHVWIQQIDGQSNINQQLSITAGDAAYTSDIGDIQVNASSNARFLLFDLY